MLDIPFYLYPGSILFRLDHYEEHALRSSLMSTWRLGILVVFTAAIAGILVWILVSMIRWWIYFSVVDQEAAPMAQICI